MKQEIPNLWNTSGKTRAWTLEPLLHKPRAKPLHHAAPYRYWLSLSFYNTKQDVFVKYYAPGGNKV